MNGGKESEKIEPPSPEEYAWAMKTAAELKEYVAGRIRAGMDVDVRRKVGQVNSAKRRKVGATEKHATWIKRARALIATGKDPRELSGIIANGDRNRAKQIRTVLQHAGLVPRRNKGK